MFLVHSLMFLNPDNRKALTKMKHNHVGTNLAAPNPLGIHFRASAYASVCFATNTGIYTNNGDPCQDCVMALHERLYAAYRVWELELSENTVTDEMNPFLKNTPNGF